MDKSKQQPQFGISASSSSSTVTKKTASRKKKKSGQQQQQQQQKDGRGGAKGARGGGSGRGRRGGGGGGGGVKGGWTGGWKGQWKRQQQQQQQRPYSDNLLPSFAAASSLPRTAASSSSAAIDRDDVNHFPQHMQEIVCSAEETAAITSPPECECWTKFASGGIKWFSPSAFSSSMWTDCLRECGMLENAKACMCARHLTAMDNTHRKMHISLKNGEVKIDLPVLHSPGIIPGCAAYMQHDYCLKCHRFEKKRFFAQKPDTPICWIRCGAAGDDATDLTIAKAEDKAAIVIDG